MSGIILSSHYIMSADTLVFDMSSASEGSPSVFVRKDWLSILDNQNRNYQGNQCIIDTSQLANSNKYMSYREAYLFIPMVLTLTSDKAMPTGANALGYAVGLKNWFGSIIHSFSLDYNGTTIVQQTPFISMWNCFKLMSSLSYDDILTQGPTIGFYPDVALGVGFTAATNESGKSTVNNFTSSLDAITMAAVTDPEAQQAPSPARGNIGNVGLSKRTQYWNFNPLALAPNTATAYTSMVGLAAGQQVANLNYLWKSYMYLANAQTYQFGISAQVYLKHLHNFFERVPILKGVFMKLILNLNQTSTSVAVTVGADPFPITLVSCNGVNSPLGGVSPIMIASGAVGSGLGGLNGTAGVVNLVASIAVGGACLNTAQAGTQISPVGGGSIQLVLPSYTFNPVFETSYLSSPVKKVIYEDVYQYTVSNVAATSPFTYLITNGIANVKSVLVLPYYSASQNSVGGATTCPPFQSPFDPAGCGPTSPFCLFTNFNIQVSGQNAIYNVERYSWEQYSNQLYGQFSVNGGMTDGLTSGLVSKQDFETEYCYYYVNVGRMLPIEEAVPKAINLIGTSLSALPLDLYVFISYGVEVSIDILSGARV